MSKSRRKKKSPKRIEQEKWHAWFSRPERAHEPWIFYMTDDFINHCVDDGAQAAVVVRRVLQGKGPDPHDSDWITRLRAATIPLLLRAEAETMWWSHWLQAGCSCRFLDKRF